MFIQLGDSATNNDSTYIRQLSKFTSAFVRVQYSVLGADSGRYTIFCPIYKYEGFFGR